MKTNKDVKALIILSIIVLIAFTGCVAKKEQNIKTPTGDINIVQGETSWCSTGSKITQTGPNGEQGTFEIKGMTTYEGKDVCKAEWTTNDGSMVQYFNNDHSYYIMIVTDKSGKVINKIDISQPKS